MYSSGVLRVFILLRKRHRDPSPGLSCNNVDGTGGLHAKWNKPDTEKKLHNLTYIWDLKTPKEQTKKSNSKKKRPDFTRDKEEGKGEREESGQKI